MTTKNNDIKIEFTSEAWAKMWAYTFSVKTEISGYGKVELIDGTFYVTDIAIFNQTVSGADTTIEAASVAKFMYELHKRGEDATQWRLWWHSHNNMEVFWSGTDEVAMSPANNIGRDWMISTVVNFRRHILGRLDIYTPVHTIINDIPTDVEAVGYDIPTHIAAEVAEKVKQRTYTAKSYPYMGYNEYNKHTPAPMARDLDDDAYSQSLFAFPAGGDDSMLLEFDNLGLDEEMSEGDYTLCRRYWSGDEKLNKGQIAKARQLLLEVGITLNGS
jgi:hypothetical protein